MKHDDLFPRSQEFTIELHPSQMNLVHTLTFCSFRIYSNIILPSTPSCSSWYLPFKFSD
jgi:hypothetical protein